MNTVINETSQNKMEIYVTYIHKDDNIKPKLIQQTIDFKQITTLEGTCGLLSHLSKNEFDQLPITPHTHIIEILHMNKWINILYLDSLAFFISSNIILNIPTHIRVTQRQNCINIEQFEMQDMINANQISMKPVSKVKSIRCDICFEYAKNEYYTKRLGPLYGPFRHGQKRFYCHFLCVLWLPRVSLNKTGRLLNVGSEVERSKREKCSYCGKMGAGLGCMFVTKGKCRKGYHYLCAKSVGCVMSQKVYMILCPHHLSFEPLLREYEKEMMEKEEEDGIKCKDGGEEVQVNKCPICLMLCKEEDETVICGKCKKEYHQKCVGYQSSFATKDEKIIGDEDEEADIKLNEEYYCDECKDKQDVSQYNKDVDVEMAEN